MKVYEIIILGIFFLFIIYYNFFYNEENIVVGCIDLRAINYNPSANKGCNNNACCEYKIEKDCRLEDHPCLCSTIENNALNQCDKIELRPVLIAIKDLNKIEHSQDLKFQELVNSGYTEHYYSKIMEISQITYMDYVHSNQESGISLQTPQYDIFIAIEMMKQKDYKKALYHINQFLDAPDIYLNNKLSAFFNNGIGCCQYDIDWISNPDHHSFQIAKIIQDILYRLDSNDLELDWLKLKLNKLKEFDKTDNTIDFIENLIFSILFSIDNQSLDFSDYGLNSLENYKYLLSSSFNDIFQNNNSLFYLSSQIDILVYLKLMIAENFLDSLKENDPANSLLDTEALSRFIELQLIYNSKLRDDSFQLMLDELNSINEHYSAAKEDEDMDRGDLENIKYTVETISNIINDYYDKLKLDHSSSFSDFNLLAYSDIDSSEFFIKSRQLINYNIFIQSINKFSDNQWYPIFKENLIKKNGPLDLINKKFVDLESKFLYYYDYDPINWTSDTVSVYHNDVKSFSIFKLLFGLQSPDKFNKIKTELDKHQGDELGANILIRSLNEWNQVINGK